MNMFDNYTGKNILVTGACGTIGAELVSTLLDLGAQRVIALDNNETELFFLQNRFIEEPRVIPELGDVRDSGKLLHLMSGVDIVFHGAALKHVILSERSPFDTVQSNVNGVQNIINAALFNKVERVLLMSSDKAVNPTNVMGTTKLLGEKLMTSANSLSAGHETIFASSRFGNVLGSRGSALPIFAKQIRGGEAVTLTDPEMTRFVMTKKEAVNLVLSAAQMMNGGEVFVTKMPVMRIEDLVNATIKLFSPRCDRDPEAVEVKIIGAKPGEKIYEELMSNEEVSRAVELKDQFAVLPAFRSVYRDIEFDYPCEKPSPAASSYRSDHEIVMTPAEIEAYLSDNGILDDLDL